MNHVDVEQKNETKKKDQLNFLSPFNFRWFRAMHRFIYL